MTKLLPLWKSIAVDHWPPEIAEHVGASRIFVHEGQQAPELLSVSAVAMTRVPNLVIYVGDGNQSSGGIKDSKLTQRLRSDLMRPIGLRAGHASQPQ